MPEDVFAFFMTLKWCSFTENECIYNDFIELKI